MLFDILLLGEPDKLLGLQDSKGGFLQSRQYHVKVA